MRHRVAFPLCLVLAALTGAPAASQAQGAKVHEHGVSHLDAVLDGDTVSLSLHGPRHNFVGFEHAAATAEEKQRVDEARSVLA